MKPILNIAGYQFVPLNHLPLLQRQLRALCQQHCLKGTILLAEEGINIMLAGAAENIRRFEAAFKALPLMDAMQFKTTTSEEIPFKRLLVKVKKEIITFAVPDVAPAQTTGQRLSAQQFKQWLDEKKALVILDTRNQCEIAAGKFANAVDLNIDHFRAFPEAVKKLAPELKNQIIVTYCTGGIRCEKASAYMLQQGFTQVYQLEGGILQYFQECGGAHFEGRCFVFDERGALEAPH